MKKIVAIIIITFITLSFFTCNPKPSPPISKSAVLGKWELVDSPNTGIWVFEPDGSFRVEGFNAKLNSFNDLQSMMSTVLMPTNGTWSVRQENYIEMTAAGDFPLTTSIKVQKLTEQQIKGYWGKRNKINFNRLQQDSNNASN